MALLTKKHKLELAKYYSELINTGDVYLYVGGISPWAVEASPPSPVDKDGEDIEIWNNMLFCKKITDKSLVVPRYDYTVGTQYQEYAHDIDLDGLQFYVYSNYGSTHNIWKCISNNNSQVKTGTNEPHVSSYGSRHKDRLQHTHENLGSSASDDGYIWKHMTTMTESEFTSFATVIGDTVGGWLPISSKISDTANGVGGVVGDNKEKAVPGEIYHMATNSPYLFSVDSTWASVLDRKVVVYGDGVDFEGMVKKITAGNYYIHIVNKGSGYFNIDKIEVNGSLTHPVLNIPWINILKPIISPIRGHAYDPVEELSTTRLMVSVDLAEAESGFIQDNQFRQVGLIYKPYTYVTSFDDYTVANGDALGTKFTGGYGTVTYKFTTDAFAAGHTFSGGNFAGHMSDLNSYVNLHEDFVVTQKNGNVEIAKGKLVEVAATSGPDIYVTFDIGYGTSSFSTTASAGTGNTTGHILTIDNGAGQSGTLTYSSVTVPTIKRYTGKILYKANIPPITRQAGSTQKIRLVLEF